MANLTKEEKKAAYLAAQEAAKQQTPELTAAAEMLKAEEEAYAEDAKRANAPLAMLSKPVPAKAFRITTGERTPRAIKALPDAARERIFNLARAAAAKAPSIPANTHFAVYRTSKGADCFTGENAKLLATGAADAIQAAWKLMAESGNSDGLKLCAVKVTQLPTVEAGERFAVTIHRRRDSKKREARQIARRAYSLSPEF